MPYFCTPPKKKKFQIGIFKDGAVKKKYDLVITELALRVMNGLELITKIRKLRPKIRIVVLSGIKCNDSLKEKLNELGVEEIFQKPKGVHDLLLYLKRRRSKHSAA